MNFNLSAETRAWREELRAFLQAEIPPGFAGSDDFFDREDQVPFARDIRRECDMAVGAVGLITEPVQAEEIVGDGNADCVFLARVLLRDPYWPRHAAAALGVSFDWPDQYKRGAVGPFGK